MRIGPIVLAFIAFTANASAQENYLVTFHAAPLGAQNYTPARGQCGPPNCCNDRECERRYHSAQEAYPAVPGDRHEGPSRRS
jgi:hypothetical protein